MSEHFSLSLFNAAFQSRQRRRTINLYILCVQDIVTYYYQKLILLVPESIGPRASTVPTFLHSVLVDNTSYLQNQVLATGKLTLLQIFSIISTKAEITLWLQSAPSWAFLEEWLAFSSVKKRFGEHSPSGFSKHFCKHTNRPFPLQVQPLSRVLLSFQLSALHSGDEFLNSSLGAAQGAVRNQRSRYSQERNL